MWCACSLAPQSSRTWPPQKSRRELRNRARSALARRPRRDGNGAVHLATVALDRHFGTLASMGLRHCPSELAGSGDRLATIGRDDVAMPETGTCGRRARLHLVNAHTVPGG